MEETSDCPICYESICSTNFIVPECGHKFHANCLLKNIRFNGYGCPYCRKSMIDTSNQPDIYSIVSAEDLPELITVSESDEEELPDLISASSDPEEPFSINAITTHTESTNMVPENDMLEDEQYILDGMRWLFQRVQGEDIVQSEIVERFESWMLEMNQNRMNHAMEVERQMNLIISELNKIDALTYEDLVRGYLFTKTPYFASSVQGYTYNQKVNSTLNSILNRLHIT